MDQQEHTIQQKTGEISSLRTVHILLDEAFYSVSGIWNSLLEADHLFCSDVAIALPKDTLLGSAFSCLIYPEDSHALRESLPALSANRPTPLVFRVITSYGVIQELRLNRLFSIEVPSPHPLEEALGSIRRNELELATLRREGTELRTREKLAALAEKQVNFGTWYLNTATGHCFFSDQVFRLFELPPQSLNAHLYTFLPFVHPDHQYNYRKFVDLSVRERVPVNFKFRIVNSLGEDRHLELLTSWSFSDQGEQILIAVFDDVTESHLAEKAMEETVEEFELEKEKMKLAEECGGIALWQLNLVTRQFRFSENFFHLIGMKPQSGVYFFDPFLNLIHPDDRNSFLESYHKMRIEHSVPVIVFRIVTAAGKVRYFRQTGKTIAYRKNQVVLIGAFTDITTTIVSNSRLKKTEAHLSLLKFFHQHAAEISQTASWIAEKESGKILVETRFLKLFGYKSAPIDTFQKILLRIVHPEYKDRITAALELVKAGDELSMEVPIITKTNQKTFRLSFQQFQWSEVPVILGNLVDITQEQQWQRELVEKQQLASTLANSFNELMLITDANHRIADANTNFAKAFRKEKESTLGKNLFEIFPHLLDENLPVFIDEALTGERVILPSSIQYHSKEDFEITLIPILVEGVTVSILHLLTNITQQKTFKRSLAEKHQLIQMLLNISDARIMIVDSLLNYRYCNHRCEEEYSINSQQIIGRNLMEVFPFRKTEPSYKEFREALDGKAVKIPPTLQPDGRWMDFHLIPILNEDGDISSVLWMSRDHTRHFESENLSNRLNHILANINEGYVELDPHQRIIEVNASALRLWNKSREQLLGKIIWDVFPNLVDQPSYHVVVRAIEEQRPLRKIIHTIYANKDVEISVEPSGPTIMILFREV